MGAVACYRAPLHIPAEMHYARTEAVAASQSKKLGTPCGVPLFVLAITQWKLDIEGISAVFAHAPNFSPVLPGDLLGDGQAQAIAGLATGIGTGLIYPVEPLENILTLLMIQHITPGRDLQHTVATGFL